MKMVVMFLTRKEHDEFAPRLLKFIGSFVASFGEEIAEDGGSHAIVTQIFDEILSITSKHHYIRARICIFITNVMSSFSQHAEISENIMDNVVERMTILMRDVSPAVRQNAIMALQRLQDPENSEDPVTRAYIYHMETDPVAKVRQAAITAIAKKLPTMNFVLDRLQDNDEKVRRHTFLQMASFPVRSYKIVDRIKILDSGLNDRSEMVKKTVLNILLPNWIAAYENNYTDFIKAIKLDSNDSELKKFSNLAEDALSAVFKKRKIEDLIGFLGLEANNCLTVDKANSLEWLTVWKVVMKIFIELKSGEVDGEEKSDEEEEQLIQQQKDIVPELTVLCEYIEKFITEFKSPTGSEAKYQKLNFNHCIITLLEIVQLNDFSDLVGCEKLKTLIKTILVEHDASDHVIKKIVDVVEQLILPVEARIAYFNGIVMEMVKMGTPGEYSRQAIIDDLIAKADIDTKVKANSLKMQMMELKEQEINFVEKKQYASAQRVTEQYAAISGQLIELLRPLASDSSASQSLVSLENLSSVAVAKKITPSEIIKNLRICFFAIMTKGVKTMTHECMNIYNDFVRYHLESSDLLTRVWALKTATAYSMLYESLAKEVYVVLKTQMMTSDNAMIWETTIGCVIDLFLRYSLTKMEQRDETIQDINGTGGTQRNKKGGRMLYTDDGEDAEGVDITVDVIQVRFEEFFKAFPVFYFPEYY